MSMPRSLLLLALTAALAHAPTAFASPIIGIGSCGGCQTWDSAIAAGNIQPVTDVVGLNNPEIDFYSTQPPAGTTFAFSEPILQTGNVTDGALVFDSLAMIWDGETGTDLAVAAWEYVYDVDPDLTGMLIEVSLYAPTGIWDFSVGLQDLSGNWAEWFVASPVPNTWTNYLLDPSNPSAVWIPGQQDPGFDITTVTTIRLDEAGQTSITFAPLQPGFSAGTFGQPQWNAWNHIRVFPPEPSGLVLMGLALAGLALKRRA